MMTTIKGNLITLAKEGNFDHIAHGCNCFSMQGAGIALQMSNNFNTHLYEMEKEWCSPDERAFESYERLGNIDSESKWIGDYNDIKEYVNVWNWYTQYQPGANFDINAFRLCCIKFNLWYNENHDPKNKSTTTLGLPMIGSGIGGGNWSEIYKVIEEELNEFNVIIVEYEEKI